MVIFQVQAPGADIWRGDLTDGFLRYRLFLGGGGGSYMEGLIFGIFLWKGRKIFHFGLKGPKNAFCGHEKI